MIAALGLFVLLYATLLAFWALGYAVLRRPPGLAHVGGLLLLELTLAVRAVLDGLSMNDTRRVADPAIHVGYLLASVLLLPLLLAITRRPGRDRDGWDAATVAAGCAAIVVVTVRLGATGQPL